MLSWKSVSLEQLESNSDAITSRKIICELGALPADEGGALGHPSLLARYSHTDGKTPAKVEESAVTAHIARDCIVFNGQGHVIKRNASHEEDVLEYLVGKGLRARGFPALDISLCDDGLHIPYRSRSLVDESYDAGRVLSSAVFQENYALLLEHGKEMMALSSRSSFSLAMMIGEDGFLRDRLASRRDAGPAADHYAERILQAVPDADGGIVREVRFLSETLANARKRYGVWTIDCHPANMLIDEGGTVEMGDFNNVLFASMQEADAKSIDWYVPVGDALSFFPLMDSMTGAAITAYDETTKLNLIARRLDEWERLTGVSVENDEYLRFLPAARAVVNARNAMCAIGKLSCAETYQDILLLPLEIGHYGALAINALEAAGIVEDDPDLYGGLAQHLAKIYGLAVGMVPEDVSAAAMEWLNR